MAALPKFSFSGWTSQSLAPKVNPASVPIVTPGLAPPGGLVAPVSPTAGQLVGTTNAANTNLPQWLADEVAKLNAAQALRTQMAGQVTGAPAPTQNIGDILQGVAAVTSARGQFNTSLNQINEQARLQNLIQQRSQLTPTGAFGFNNPFDVSRQLDLDRQIEGYRNVNLPLAAGAVSRSPSGWVQPSWGQPTWR